MKNFNSIPTWLQPIAASLLELTRDDDKASAIKKLQYFDTRDRVFRQVVAENQNNVEGLSESFHAYCRHGINDVVTKTAIGKVWAKKLSAQLSFDYDASLYSNYIFWKTIFPSEQSCPIEPLTGYQYIIHSDGLSYRGDTINSWVTTLHEFFRLFGGGEGGYLRGLIKNNTPGTNEGKWRLPETGPGWHEFLSISKNYKRPLPSYITEFMEVVYTPGNFIPIPHSCNVYTLQDYFDLKLYCIYNWFQDRFDAHIMTIINDGKCRCSALNRLLSYKRWLQKFPDWDTFVKHHSLQPFVTVDGSHFGKPKELWDGHFTSCFELPKTESEFEQFFVNAKNRILARGAMIAERLVDEINCL